MAVAGRAHEARVWARLLGARAVRPGRGFHRFLGYKSHFLVDFEGKV